MQGRMWAQLEMLLIIGLALSAVEGQTTRPKEDSGWTSLFNGTNLNGLYVRQGDRLQTTQTIFVVQGDSIFSSGTLALLTTKKVYSRYQSRMKFRYATNATGLNGGFIYHIEPRDYDTTTAILTTDLTVPYFFGRGYPQAIEFQTYVGNTGGFIGIGNLWAQSTIVGSQVYSPTGTAYTTTPSGGFSRYITTAYPNTPPDRTKWAQCQINVYGGDSVVHFVDGLRTVKAWNILHIAPDGQPTSGIYATSQAGATLMDRGHIGIQSEGNVIYYRDWDIRLLDAQGRPIIPGCTNPSASNYNNLATQDNGSCTPTGLISNRSRSGKSGQSRRIYVGGLTTSSGYLDVKGRILQPAQ